MEPMRTRFRKSNLANFRLGWLNARRRSCSQLNQNRAKLRQQLPLKTGQTDAGPFIVDLLDVNAELSYTTVVEGLEEFLYQKESQKYA
jgi:hypothetical protein